MPDFQSTYGDNPWEGITDKTRDIFIPDLLDVYRRDSFFRPFVPFRVDLGARNAEKMYFTKMYELLDDRRELGLRQLWMEPFHTDTERKAVTMKRYGGKVALHTYDELINQWRLNGVSALRQINRQKLATQMTRTLDLLARDAFLSGTWHLYGANGTKANFGALDDTNGADNFDPAMAQDIWLGMQTRAVHGAVDAAGTGQSGTIIALTSPGVVFAMRQNSSWIDAVNYANPELRVRYEVGTYMGVRYLVTPDMILWNCGALDGQWAVTEALYPGSGAARNVDANREVGQETLTNGNRYIQLDATNQVTSVADDITTIIEPNDIVTIHLQRTNAYGVTNGVDYKDGSIVNRRVVNVDNATKRIELDMPVLRDFTTDQGGGVYAYVSKGTNVHATAFLTGPTPVVAGVGKPPMFHTPPPVDDFEAYYRFTWDAYMGFQIWDDFAVEVSFNTGPVRTKGTRRY